MKASNKKEKELLLIFGEIKIRYTPQNGSKKN